jgi:hypothetical protein
MRYFSSARTFPDVHVQVRRDINASPDSVALLLSGPEIAAAWPGLESVRHRDRSGRWMIRAQSPDGGHVESLLEATRPQAGRDGRHLTFAVEVEDGTRIRGTATITAYPDPQKPAHRCSSLTLTCEARGPLTPELPAAISGFMRNVCTMAESHATVL